MTIDRRSLIGAGMVLPLAAQAAAQGTPAMTPWPPRDHVRLWPGRPPGSPAALPAFNPSMNGPPDRPELWLRGVAEPIVAVYRPERADGRAVLAIPGGGYGFVSVENEGINVARAMNPMGVTVFVLAYRLPGEGWADPTRVPLQDAQRAMRVIRSRAADFRIDPARIGVVGFSAGGHLAGSLLVAHDEAAYERVDAADDGSARPDFAGLVYPVTGPMPLLAGNRAVVTLQTYGRYDVPARLSAESPPLFILHALDDGLVPLSHPRALFDATVERGVPVEAHFIEQGGHGFGAANLPERASGRPWIDLFDRWIGQRFGAPRIM